jgi:hypothetical protein
MIPAMISDIADNEFIEAVTGGFAGCLSLLMVPITMALFFFMPASLLFAAVEQRFGAGFEFGRIWAFVKANIGNYLLSIVICIIARIISDLGFILCCVGILFTSFWATLIMAHGFAQAYKLRRA